MRRKLAILGETDADLMQVIAPQLVDMGYSLIQGSSVAHCLESLDLRYSRPTLLLGNASLWDGALMASLEFRTRELMGTLPPLIVWTDDEEALVRQHAGFLARQLAWVLPLPLDLERLAGAILYAEWLTCPAGMDRGATSGAVGCACHATGCARLAPFSVRHLRLARCCDAFWRGRRKPRRLAETRRRLRG